MATATGSETDAVDTPTAEDATPTRPTFRHAYPQSAKLTRYCFAIAFGALGVGGLLGLIQGLHRTGVFRGVISSTDYYTVLTGHGVLLVLVFTTYFIAGLFTWLITSSLERPVESPRLAWGGFLTLTLGTVLAAIPILGGVVQEIPASADVLFTFYAPMKAHPAFYVGAALIVVGSWILGASYFTTYRAWRREHPEERIPLQTFMVLTTYLMWYIATLGVATEVVVFLIPWSLGLISQVDPLLTRTLFWYFGHPVVYFWLLPAYIVWYTILPKLSGGRLLSDPAARVVFVLFLLLSTPVGFHHQYVDPGIAEGYKFVAMTNTMFLLLPSLLTAFTVVASMEHGARQNGGTGRLAWLKKLPWGEPAFSGCALAGLMFAAGGFSGMINAGMNINYLIHNTIWIPGHFHLTVGTAFALTAMAITYWLLPQLLGKQLRLRNVAAVQPYLWFIGMVLMSNAMHRAGLIGIPRRTAEPQYSAFDYPSAAGGLTIPGVIDISAVQEMRYQIAIGGTILFISLLCFLAVITKTWLAPRAASHLRVNSEIPEPLSGPEDSPRVLDRIWLWAGIAVLLVAIAYGIPLFDLVADGLLSPGSSPIPV